MRTDDILTREALAHLERVVDWVLTHTYQPRLIAALQALIDAPPESRQEAEEHAFGEAVAWVADATRVSIRMSFLVWELDDRIRSDDLYE